MLSDRNAALSTKPISQHGLVVFLTDGIEQSRLDQRALTFWTGYIDRGLNWSLVLQTGSRQHVAVQKEQFRKSIRPNGISCRRLNQKRIPVECCDHILFAETQQQVVVKRWLAG